MIILRQREFNSKAQKKIKEKWEVLKGQEILDKEMPINRKGLEETLRSYESLSPAQKASQSGQEIARGLQQLKTSILTYEELSKDIHKEPNIKLENPSKIDEFVNYHRNYNKALAREGSKSSKEFGDNGAMEDRAERVAKRKQETRGVKKVRGQKNPEGNTQSMKDRIWNLSPKRREEVFRREEERAKILKEEARKERERHIELANEKARKLNALKKANIKKSIKKAAPWVIGGTLATAGTVAGVKAYKKHKKDKEK